MELVDSLGSDQLVAALGLALHLFHHRQSSVSPGADDKLVWTRYRSAGIVNS